jgi:hypothetical protein
MRCCDRLQQQSQKKSKEVPLVVTELISVVKDTSEGKCGKDDERENEKELFHSVKISVRKSPLQGQASRPQTA